MRFRFPGIPNISLYIIIGQVFVYIFFASRPDLVSAMLLVPSRVLDGELWRLFSFVFVPPATNAIFAFFSWYLFYLMGNALEGQWGASRYTAFLSVGAVATALSSFLTPGFAATNAFLGGSVFLAFARLYPDFTIMLFFVLPVRIRWLALFTWVWYALEMIVGSWTTRAMVLAATANYLIFFGRDILMSARQGHREMAAAVADAVEAAKPRHTCAECARTDKTDPRLEFRYCTKCNPARCYCADHISSHAH